MRHVILLCMVLSSVGCAYMQNRSSAKKMQTREVEPVVREDEEEPRKRVVVLPFLIENDRKSQALGEMARQSVVRDLIESRRFLVVNNADVPNELMGLRTDNMDYDLEKIAPKAQNLGAAAVLEGRVLDIKIKKLGDAVGVFRKTKVRVEATIRTRVVAARNGKEIVNETRTASIESTSSQMGEGTESLEDDPQLTRQAVQKAFAATLVNIVKSIEKLSWEGRVALVSGDRIYLNAGRLSGLVIGDILKVSEEGEEIHDPDSGLYIGTAPGRLKGTLEVVSYFGKDGAISVVHSGSGFKENDRVELY